MGSLEDSIKNIFSQSEQKKSSTPMRYDPDNEYSHKNSLITNYDISEIDNLPELLNKQIVLARFDDDLDVQIAVRDLGLVITPLWLMSRNEKNTMAKEVVQDLLKFFYIKFQGKVLLSRTKGGFERNLQANKPTTSKKAGFSLKNFRKEQQEPQESDNERLYED